MKFTILEELEFTFFLNDLQSLGNFSQVAINFLIGENSGHKRSTAVEITGSSRYLRIGEYC